MQRLRWLAYGDPTPAPHRQDAAVGAEDRREELIAEARRWVGAGPGERITGRDPVNRPMIHHWCQALGDHNPAYLDEDVAARTRHGGIVAPPGMLQTWTMDAAGDTAVPPGRRADAEDGHGGSRRGSGEPSDEVLARLDAAGYTSVVATDYEHEYHRQLRPGERVSRATAVEDLSEEKSTALGDGRFVTLRHEYTDGDGELVGVGRMRLLKFRPPDGAGDGQEAERDAGDAGGHASGQDLTDPSLRPAPPTNRDNQFFWDGVAEGRLLVQRCSGCGTRRHPPRPMCGRCRSTDWEPVEISGRGTLYSWVVHHHPPLPGFELPHPVALVELEEDDLRLVAETAGIDPDDLWIGMSVRVVVEDVSEELTVPVVRPREESS